MQCVSFLLEHLDLLAGSNLATGSTVRTGLNSVAHNMAHIFFNQIMKDMAINLTFIWLIIQLIFPSFTV